MKTLNKMRGKTKISTIALVLMLTIAVTLVAIPAANAQVTMKTYPFIGAVPNPVGVGQTVLFHVGITLMLQSIEMGWEGLWVTIERPDGTTAKIENIRTDSTGGTGVTYVPAKAGNYTLQTHFPEQVITADKRGGSFFTGFVPVGTVMLASESEKLALVVEEEPVPYHPGFPLPTEYWTRPIDAQLREWSTIAGSWLFSPPNLFAPYNDDAPESAHILWAKPFTTGGLAGGELGPQGFECGDAYEGKWGGSIILAGRLYYRAGGSRRLEPVVYHCVDLHTGEELWSKIFLDNRTLSFGQLFYWDSYNYHGVFAYLWVTVGSDWHAFDAYTGDWRYTIENVPSGTTLRGSKGEIYRLQVDLDDGWMALWNASALGSWQGSWGNSVHMRTLDAAANTTAAERAWSWNKTIPTGLPGSVQAVFLGDRIIGSTVTRTEVTSWGLSLKSGQEGTLMFNRTWEAPTEWTAGNVTVIRKAISPEGKDGVFVVWAVELGKSYGFSTDNGEFLWETEPEHYLNHFGIDPGGRTNVIAYGKMFTAGVCGIVYCDDVKTGKRLWTYEAYDPYQEILWANNWWGRILFITDGKIYLGHSEHSPIDPKPRGAPFYCLNATTGDEIFRVDGLLRQTHWGGRAIIGDSVIATMDTYDQRIYAIGKGPSATTVSIQNDVITQGSSVLIQGMVTDVSPGAKEPALTARFPNGVPAMADEHMGEWMQYVYKQFPRPADATGVEVTLDAIDPNGNWIHIDTVTSDASGMFKKMWTPEIEGEYTIIATFIGTESYYASYAQTGLGVGAAPEEPITPATEPEVQADIDRAIDSLTPMFLGIIAAIVVVAILVIYTLYTVRKRK